MKTHEQINYACSKGLYPVVQRNDGEVCIFSPDKDYDGNYRRSAWWSVQAVAEGYIGSSWGWAPENMEKDSQEENWKIIGYYERPYEKYEVGDKVVVKKTGEVGEIAFYGRFAPYNVKVKNGHFYFLHSELLPYFDTTPSEEEVIKAKETLEKAGKLKDGKYLID